MYYSIGSKLIKNNKWGSSFIDNLARDLKMDFPTIKGMSARNLRYMQKFAANLTMMNFCSIMLQNYLGLHLPLLWIK